MAKYISDTNSIQVTWNEPEMLLRGGQITKYTVLYYTETNPQDDISEDTHDTELVVVNPYPVTQYIFQVRAYTTVGNGPYSTEVYVVTPPERKFSAISYYPLHAECQDLILFQL